ncbi:MAG TPA: DUF4396 domain-containing protein [Bacteroidia bacterium]
MTHTYQIAGMSCTNCEATIKSSLIKLEDVTDVEVSKAENLATITMKKHISIEDLQLALNPKYKITPIESSEVGTHQAKPKSNLSWTDFAIWKRAGFNTLNCLMGCSIGDFSMVIFLQHFYPATPMMVQMILSTLLGLITSIALETTILHTREKLIWQKAFKIAIGMSFLSMVAMEIAMNTMDFMITGGKMALSNPYYWLAFIPSAIVGFSVPLPYNYYQLKKHNKACH